MSADDQAAPGAVRAKRGRPSKAQAEAIDQAILEAARACFLATGFEGATMEAVADQAGVTKVTLYARYPDKSRLLRAVLEERLKVWSLNASQVRWVQGDTLEARLKHYASSMLHWGRLEDVRAFDRLLQSNFRTPDPVAKELQQIVRAPMLAMIGRDIADYGAREGKPVDDPRRVAVIFMGMLRGFSDLGDSALTDFDQAVADFADRVVAILLQGRDAW